MTQRANCSVTPHTERDLRLPAGVPGLHDFISDLHERNFLHSRISQKRLGRGVFTIEVVAPRDSSPRSGSVTRQPRRATERPGPQCVPVAGRIEALPLVEGLSNSG